MRCLAFSLLILSAALLAAACDDADAPGTPDDAPSSGATFERSPTADPSKCPVDADVCDFATTLAGWLRNADSDSVLDNSAATEVTCTGAPPGSGIDSTLPLCQAAPAGEVRAGYPVGRLQSEGATFPAVMIERALQTRFGSDYPTRELELASIGCPILERAETSCDERFAVVFRAPEGVMPQSLLAVIVERAPAQPLIRNYYSGLIELNPEMVEGGTSEVALVDATSAGTQYERFTAAQ